MIRATRRPTWHTVAWRIALSGGAALVLLGILLSSPGLPVVPGLAQGAVEQASAPPDVAVGPPTIAGPGTGSTRTARRHAVATTDLCARGPRAMTAAEVVYHGPDDRKVVALTFDDGWGRATTRKILRILVEKRVNATFFPVGEAVRHDPDTWRRVAAAGFPIANHTFDHGKLKNACYLEQRRELSRARATYESVLGVSPLPVMRPPGGLFDSATLAAATAAGAPTLVLWDVDSSDWMGIGARRVRRNALDGGKGSIVVLHTSSMSTVRALPGIIRGYRERGFEFVTIGQLLGIPGVVPYPANEGG